MFKDTKNVWTLSNCKVVTVDALDHYYREGRVIIENGRIQAVGAANEIPIQGQEFNLGGRILMPGLVNTHTHSPSSIFRGLADDLPLRIWLEEHMWPAEKNLTADLALLASRLSYLEYLTNGMTTNVDMWYFAESVMQAAKESGLRSFIAAGIFSFPSPESDDSLGAAEAFLARQCSEIPPESRVRPAVGPHDAYSCSPEILSRTAALAKNYGVLTTIHLSEAKGDNEEILQKYGVSPTRYMEECGLFENPVVCAHGIYLSGEDLDILHRHNVGISYNPVSNMKLCDGVLPLKHLMEKKVPVSIGVDGAQSNNSLSLLADIKTGVLLQKITMNDPAFFTAGQAVHMMTIDGAAAVGMADQIGSIEVGKRADLITLDVDFPGFTPLDDRDIDHVYSHIIYTSPRVNDVFVDGEILMRDKLPLRVNAEKTVQDLKHAAKALLFDTL